MIAIILALFSALFFSLGTVLQQKGTLQTAASVGNPRFLIEIFRKPVWLLGALFQFIGGLLQIAALHEGSLALVQSLIALSLVFALPFGVWLTGQYIGRRTILGACATLLGILAFIGIGQPQRAVDQPPVAALLIAGLVTIALMLLLAWQGLRHQGAVTAALFSVAAGFSFALAAAFIKEFTMLLVEDLPIVPFFWAIIVLLVSALAAFALQQSALKTGFLAPAMAGTNATTLIGSVLLGILLFQEPVVEEQGLLFLASCGLALATLGVVLLAHPEARPITSDVA